MRDKNLKFRDTLIHFLILREKCAVRKNLPRNFCATDNELIQLCEQLPRNHLELSRIGMDRRALVKGVFKEQLLNLCSGLR